MKYENRFCRQDWFAASALQTTPLNVFTHTEYTYRGMGCREETKKDGSCVCHLYAA